MPLYALGDSEPRVPDDAFVAPTATLIGAVELGAEASVWFGAVLRGDFDLIVVGAGSCIQDNAVAHAAEGLPTVIGANVTVGHAALLEGCVVSDGALIPMGAIVLQRARIGAGSLVAAGSVVREGQEIPPGVVAAGPAVVKKEVDGSSRRWIESAAREYREPWRRYLEERWKNGRRRDGEDADRGRADRRDGDGRAEVIDPRRRTSTRRSGRRRRRSRARCPGRRCRVPSGRGRTPSSADIIRKALDLIVEHRATRSSAR